MTLQGKSLIIGPLTFTITRHGGRKDYGSINMAQQKIFVSPDLQRDMITVTLLHEALHGILYLGQYNEESENEKLVDCLAVGILDLLKRNKWLRDMI